MIESNQMDVEHRQVKEIPYGISDYVLIRNKNYYYVDKTPFLRHIEKVGRYLFFIRPRRFGKSLFLALMNVYFDAHYKERFDELFKGTWIYGHPTEERNNYLILRFNFAEIDPNLKLVETSFLNHIQIRSLRFIRTYYDLLASNNTLHYYEEKIKESHSASDIISIIVDLCRTTPRKLYIMIDEYDNFANTILSTEGEKSYQNLTHGAGFFKSFFNVIKGGSTGSEAPIERIFITGVSPVTMDDVTSGFNIGDNISLDPIFKNMLGFTQNDVISMIEYYRTNGLIHHPTEELMEIMTEWYGNYRFSSAEDEILFNSDMILYFFRHYLPNGKIPEDLVDRNVRIDYGKLRHLIIIDKNKIKTTNGNFAKLKEIIENNGISTKIVKGFPLEELTKPVNFTSLLFYFGLLTIKTTDRDKIRLEIPNETIKRLFYDYIEGAYRETNVFNLDLDKYSNLMTDMAYDGKWKPLFEFITQRMRESMSLRDCITGEKSIQAFLNVYLGLTNLYIIHTERELNKGYADIFMEPLSVIYKDMNYSYLLEIKYINAGLKPEDPQIQQLILKAQTQLNQYSIDEKFKKSLGNTQLIKIILIFSGPEAVYIGEAL